jgi:DNA polymerase-3 subunit epsilon
MVRVCGGIDAERTFLIKPPNHNFRFTYIHGIRWDDVRDSPTFAEVYNDISEFIEGADYLGAHNAPFDRGVLKSCCEYWGLEFPEVPFLCTLKGCRKKLSLQKNSLDFVCSRLNIPLKHHDAKSDAIAAAKIFIHLRELGLSYADLLVK